MEEVSSGSLLWKEKKTGACLPAAFQFWALPKVLKLLDKKVNVLVFGGETINKDPYNQGMLSMLLTTVKIQNHFLVCEQFEQTFSKGSFVDTS